MSVIRVKKTKDFTVMSNAHLRDKELSLKGKGLLSVMLGLPDGWDFSVEGLVSICLEGKESVRSTLAELEEKNYLSRRKLTDDKGRFYDVEYTIYENRQGIFPLSDNPMTDNPMTENPPQLNTYNNKILKQSNIKEIKDIVDYLNLKVGSNYKSTSKETKKHINARLNEGYTVDDFKKVIDNKVAKWKDDPKMSQYLRPMTLFGSKFEGYVNENCVSQSTKSSNGYGLNSLFDVTRG